MTQLSLFPDMLEPWQEQKLKWWEMHGFRPEKGVVAVISATCAKGYPNGGVFYALWVECEIMEVYDDKIIVKPILSEESVYHRVPYELWEVRYFGVDPILYK